MKIKFFASVLALLLLFGCSRSSGMDINIFFDGFNKASEITDFSPTDSVFSTENNLRTHYCRINKNVLITLNSLQDGTIYRCTISFDHSGDFNVFKDAIYASIASFCNKDIETCTSILKELKLVQKNLINGYSAAKTTDLYNYNCESSQNATVFIIRANRYSPETNTSPTLKEH